MFKDTVQDFLVFIPIKTLHQVTETFSPFKRHLNAAERTLDKLGDWMDS